LLLLPEVVSLWLLRAWGRFGKSNSSFWFNQMRLGSSCFLLESKRNRASKFLSLSVFKNGRRSFVIFPTGRNGSGWARIFDVLSELVSFPNRRSGGEQRVSLSQGALLNKRFLPILPPPPLGCCPKCGFSGEPSCFL